MGTTWLRMASATAISRASRHHSARPSEARGLSMKGGAPRPVAEQVDPQHGELRFCETQLRLANGRLNPQVGTTGGLRSWTRFCRFVTTATISRACIGGPSSEGTTELSQLAAWSTVAYT